MVLRLADDSSALLDITGEEVSLQRAWEFVYNWSAEDHSTGPLQLVQEFTDHLDTCNRRFVFHLCAVNREEIIGFGESPRVLDAARNAVLNAAVVTSELDGEWRKWKNKNRIWEKKGKSDTAFAQQVRGIRESVASDLNSLIAVAAGHANPRFLIEVIEDEREHRSALAAAKNRHNEFRAETYAGQIKFETKVEELRKTAEIASEEKKQQAARFAKASRESLQEKETLQKTLEDAANILKGVKEECEQLRKELERSQRELETTKAKDEERKQELERCREELRQMRAERAFALTADAETMSETSEDSELEQLFAFAVEKPVSPQALERLPVELSDVLEDLARVKLRLDTLEARQPA